MAETTSTIAKPAAAAFPAAAVGAKLRSALLDFVKSTAALHGIALPPGTTNQYSAAVHLDSLSVVDVLCDIEPIVSFPLKDSIVKPGGYGSIDEAIAHVLPRIEAAWKKHAGIGAKK